MVDSKSPAEKFTPGNVTTHAINGNPGGKELSQASGGSGGGFKGSPVQGDKF